MEPLTLTPIGVVRSPWKQKFAIPRQSGLARAVEVRVELDRDVIPAEALRGLDQVSHLWLLCWLHADADRGWRPTVRPPRLGGDVRLGVLATRSPHRPNPIALSLVRLIAVEDRSLRITEADLLDGTPVLDVKPYVPWADQRSEARCAWAPGPPELLAVRLSPAAASALARHPTPEVLEALIRDSLGPDPRPAHQRGDPSRSYVAALLDVDVRFCVDADGVLVTEISARAPEP